MNTGEPPEEFATIVSVSPGSIPLRTPEARDAHHRTCPTPVSRRLPTQQSDALLSQSAPVRHQLTRGQSQIQSAAKFVGIGYGGDSPTERSDWDGKRLRFLKKRYGLQVNALQSTANREGEGIDAQPSLTPSAIETPSVDGRQMVTGPASFFAARSPSQDSRVRLEKRDSVAKVVYDAVSSFMKRGTINRPKPRHAPLAARSSFDVEAFDDVGVVGSPVLPGMMSIDHVPTIPEELSSEVAEAEAEPAEPAEPVVKVEEGESIEMHDIQRPDIQRPDSLSSGTRPLYSHRRRFMGFTGPAMFDENGLPIPQPRHCFAQIGKARSGIFVDRSFDREEREKEEPLRRSVSARARAYPSEVQHEPLLDTEGEYKTVIHVAPPLPGIGRLDLGDATIQEPPSKVALGQSLAPEIRGEPDRYVPRRKLTKQKSFEEVEKPPESEWHLRRMEKVMDHLKLELVPHRKKRVRGVGAIGSMFNHHLGRKEVGKLPPIIREKLEAGEDERPFFTYWVTSVQIVVFIVSIIYYGIGPFAIDRVETSGEVTDTSLALRHVSYFQPGNIFIGPRFSDLVRLGAKYSPCMRKERGVWKDIEMERRKENETACCIFNDRAGCYQTGENGCPRNIATWYKWTNVKPKGLIRSKSDSSLLKSFDEATDLTPFNRIPHTRSAGAVCGQDPDFCIVPRSAKPREWPDDLTQWPICKQSRTEGALPPHLTCQITGRPCCIQMQGQCRITTKQYCEFVQGYWHENATLCSQVDCFGDICGMLPFFTKDQPNQAYRLFTSLFIHAGIFHLLVTIFVQRWIMVDLEHLIGWKRMAIVYVGSGIGGNLASAIFVPYNPEVGPSGSQLGIVAALIIDVIHHRTVLANWKKALAQHIGVVMFLFLLGVMPFVDNWAHLFGFIFGLLITLSVFPYLDFSSKSIAEQRTIFKIFPLRRCLFVLISSAMCFLLFAILAYIYFSNIEVNCPLCSYFNCMTFFVSDHFCDNKGLELTHMLPI